MQRDMFSSPRDSWFLPLQEPLLIGSCSFLIKKQEKGISLHQYISLIASSGMYALQLTEMVSQTGKEKNEDQSIMAVRIKP